MTWPIDDLSTDSLDSQNDRPSRREFFKIFQRVKSMIRARGRPGGVASLRDDGKVPVAQLPGEALQNTALGVPNGAASLNANGDVPLGQIPETIARLNSPRLSGNPTAPTPPADDNSGRLATTRFVSQQRDSLTIATGSLTATVTTSGGRDRSSSSDGGGPGSTASGSAILALPARGRVLLPVRVSVRNVDLNLWQVTPSILPSEIRVAVRSKSTGSRYNNQRLTVVVEYEYLKVG
ncbi:hypothetical protein [Tateyamaria sp.]|uniref:hypothetical protein n=1 Tax=Tateyamaria sp. TaxID=1929288 RepID=UPI003B21FE60